jgi:hypothetical protein
MPLEATYIMNLDSIQASRDWFVSHASMKFRAGESSYYPLVLRSEDSHGLKVTIVTNLELDGVEEFLQYDGYPGEAPVVSIISKYPDHPVYDYARSHPELFTPVADFSCWIDGESLYRGPAPIPEEVLERLRRG